jgi:hypothetical protein
MERLPKIGIGDSSHKTVGSADEILRLPRHSESLAKAATGAGFVPIH